MCSLSLVDTVRTSNLFPGNKLVTLLGYDNIVSHMQSTPFQECCTGSAKKQPKNLSLTLQHTHHFLRQLLKAREQTFAMRMNFYDKQVFSVVMVVKVLTEGACFTSNESPIVHDDTCHTSEFWQCSVFFGRPRTTQQTKYIESDSLSQG